MRTILQLSAMVFVLQIQTAHAQETDLDLRRLPWDIVSETMDFDGKTSTVIYTGLRFSQGSVSIEADEGRATSLAQKTSIWNFSGNVVIDVDNGHISCDSATLQFDGNILSTATVNGAPATFELTRIGGDDVTNAEAKLLNYDVERGIIEFSGNAVISEAGNRISANSLIYNIAERRINADARDEDDDRVRIIYTPTDEEVDGLAQEVEEQVETP
jgi:lipopolysaccharide export system protein LptA